MARYDVFKKLQELTAMVKTEKGFSKFVQTGEDYYYCDYGVGFLEIVLEKYHSKSNGWSVIFRIDTIDDGGYIGRRAVRDESEADKVIQELADKAIKNMIALPDLATLNVLLRPYDIFVSCEG